MACLLRISGRFDPSALPLPSPLEADRRWSMGDEDLFGRAYTDSGIQLVVSDRALSDFDGQVDDAVRFLDNHGGALEPLCRTAGVSHRILDFAVELPGGGGAAYRRLPERLIALAAECGLSIELSFFAVESEADAACGH